MDIREFQNHLWQLFRAIGQGLDGPLGTIVQAHGITMTQLRILMEVDHRSEMTVGELSQALGSASANSSAMCKTLEKKGLVSRDRSPEDERIVLITLTPEGKRVLHLIEEDLSSKFDPVLEGYSPGEFEQIISGMEKLKEVVTSLQQAFQNSPGRR
ncbi:MarR family winged helix-turn-helix transcriptional regulator [Candidatus Darwinibacter acetoxidans]